MLAAFTGCFAFAMVPTQSRVRHRDCRGRKLNRFAVLSVAHASRVELILTLHQGGAISSLVYRQLLSSLGLRKSLAIFTAIHAVSFTAGYCMMDERRPASKRPKLIWFDRAFFRDPVFWSLALCFFFTVLYARVVYCIRASIGVAEHIHSLVAAIWGPSSSCLPSPSRRLLIWVNW